MNEKKMALSHRAAAAVLATVLAVGMTPATAFAQTEKAAQPASEASIEMKAVESADKTDETAKDAEETAPVVIEATASEPDGKKLDAPIIITTTTSSGEGAAINGTQAPTEREKLDQLAARFANVLPDGDYYIKAFGSNCVLDVASASKANWANIALWSVNGGNHQKWTVTHDEKGYVTFTNINSGQVLASSTAKPSAGANINQAPSKGTLNQKWIVSSNDDGSFRIRSAASDGVSLNVQGGSKVSGANVQVWNSNWTNNAAAQAQKFQFVSTVPSVEPCEDLGLSGMYTIAPASNSNLRFDVARSSTANGAELIAYNTTGGMNQLFKFTYVDGYYRITSAVTGGALTVVNPDVSVPSTISMYAPKAGDDAQLFSIQKVGGNYKLINKANGLVVNIAGSGSGADVNSAGDNGSNSQRFAFNPAASLLVDGACYTISTLASNTVLDLADSSLSQGANVSLWNSHGGTNQHWIAECVDAEKNIFCFRSVRSGQYLTMSGDNVVQSSKAGAASEWRLVPAGGGVVLRNVQDNNKVLSPSGSGAPSGANIVAKASTGALNQRFTFAHANIVSDGYYIIRSFQVSSQVLDVSGGSEDDSANVASWTFGGHGNQKWYFENKGNDVYLITNAKSGKALDVLRSNDKIGANIAQYNPGGTANQLWKVRFNSNGTLSLVSQLDNHYVLSIAGSAANGSNVELGADTLKSNSTFRLQATTYNPGPTTGDEDLDNRLKAIVARYGGDLHAMFNYVASFPYRGGSVYPSGDWSVPFAKEMLDYGSGNCYRFAALFRWLAIFAGYDCQVISGSVPSISGGYTPHGWTEVYINGNTYVCDPDSEHELPGYNWYMTTYASAPYDYHK